LDEARVGWVERSDTHRRKSLLAMMGIGAKRLNHPTEILPVADCLHDQLLSQLAPGWVIFL